MDPNLQQESESLTRSWMRHESATLRDYLVDGVEDPRINVQSVLTRHFLVRHLFPGQFEQLMAEEIRFASAINGLAALLPSLADPEELEIVLHALSVGSDNAEGIQLPAALVHTYPLLPAVADGVEIPNYLTSALRGASISSPGSRLPEVTLSTFLTLWATLLEKAPAHLSENPKEAQPQHSPLLLDKAQIETNAPASTLLRRTEESDQGRGGPTVLEPACGSANDYRFLRSYGLSAHLRYTGFDLCAKNIENARALFPDADFRTGNVFEITAADRALDLCYVHDLFEHLSPEGIRRSCAELARVTRQAMCLHFFNMDEVRDHQIRPVEQSHWNLLSMGRMKDLFARLGFEAQVLHIGTFLRIQAGCGETHNPNAYTFLLTRSGDASSKASHSAA